MTKRILWVVLLSLTAFACHDNDTVSGPGGVAYPGITVSHAEWSLCGRHSIEPSPDYNNPELAVTVEQRDSHFVIRVPDVGTIVGELAPFEPGIMRYTWTLRFDPPCSGVAHGADSSPGIEMRFTFPADGDWQCAPCTDASGGMVRLYIPPQPI